MKLKPAQNLPLFAAAAAVALGHAIQIDNGQYHPDAIPWLTLGVAAALAGWFVPSPRWRGATLALCLAGIVWQIFQNLRDLPMAGIVSPVVFFCYCSIALPVMALGAAGAVLIRNWSRTVFIPILLGAHFITGAWLLSQSAKIDIDVYTETRDACVALSHGINPYDITFPWNVQPRQFPWARTQYGYQYMPLSLEVEWIGQTIADDFRYTNLLAITAAGALLAYATASPLAPAAAAILLLSPRGYFVIEQGWAEPAAILCVALVVFLAVRNSRQLPWAVGLLLISKQYMVVSLLALPLLPRRSATKTILAAAVVTLPLVLWNPAAFWHSAVIELMDNPFRSDSLNFAAMWVRAGHSSLPQWLPFVVAILAGGFAMVRAPRNTSGFAAAVSLILICFFALAKQAFCNYYLLIIGALCCCVATADEP